MKTLIRVGALVFGSSLWSSVADAAGDSSWPLWRGDSGAGIARDAQPPTTWGEDKNVRWKTKIPGSGFSTPIIWKDRIFLLTAIETDEKGSAPVAEPAAGQDAEPARKGPPPGGERKKGGKKGGPGGGMAPTTVHEFAVVAIDRKTGAIAWQKTARREVPHEGHHPTNSFASQSPVTDGERLYVSFGSHGLYCFDLKGNLVWEKNLGLLRSRNGFGEGASPALAGPHLIVPWDQQGGSFIVGLDKKTGAEVWRKERDEVTTWTTPLVVEVGGKLQAIVAASKSTRSYDTATGELVWEAGGLTSNVIPTPVTGHGLVYVMSGYSGNAIQAIKLTARGDVTTTSDIVWSARKSAPYVASPVLSGDRLYMSKGTDAYLSCLNALTGEVYYQDQKLDGLRGLYASPVAANGYVYVVGRDGTAVVLKDATKYEVIATNKLDEPIDASPVAVDTELFLRGHGHLYCIAEK